MDVGAILIYIALILAIGSAFLSLVSLYYKKIGATIRLDIIYFYSKFASILTFIAVSASLILLYIYFMTSNMDIEYVWEYSSKSLSWEYKMSAVLAGMSGSLLFWIWCIVLCWFVEEIIDLRRPKDDNLMAWTRLIMMTVSAVFLYFLVLRDLFGETPQSFLNALPDGNGLNPLLQTPLMIVHPPVVFLAYGFCAIALAASVGYLFTNNKKWVNISLSWSRWAWIFLTLGIGIGGLWAYVVLGWGGYWAWDPVETSSFLPWIILTAFLHAQLMNKRKGDYKYAAPALGIYTFALVIFATFTTRAGGIWQSVHAFGSADVNKTAWDRFWEVTTSDGIILGYFLLMMIIAIGGAMLLIWALMKRGGLGEDISSGKPKSFIEEVINDKSLMFLTLIIFAISTIITLFLLILSINGADRTQFDTKVGFFTMVGIVLLFVCLIWKHLGRMATLISLLLSGGISFLLAVLYPDNWIIVASMPFLLLALGASIYKIIKSINTRSLRGSVNAISPHIVHLGVVLLVIGFVGSNFLVTEKEIILDLDGPTEKVGEYEFNMVDVESTSESLFAFIEIRRDGIKIGEAKPGVILIDGQARNEIDVFNTLAEDVYLTYIEVTPNNMIKLNVKILPWMSLLWSGMWLLAIGIVIRLIVDYTRPKLKEEGRVQKRARLRESEEKDDDYYDDLIERELREMG
jgi:cytochrome c-type biogenesis protein CcmF